jgi:serine/threonine-protein kinase
VLIDREGRGKVTDFGIARSLEADGLTAAGRVLGTTDYVSPEQALGRDVTPQSDLYSLGICLYEMLTGETPFRSDTQVGVAMQHVKEPIPDVQRRRPEISAALAAIIDRATAKETEYRYPSADEMVLELEHVLGIEAARAGETTGEATTVLRALPGDTADFAPARLLRTRKRVLFSSMILLGLVAGLIAFFATRTEKGPGPGLAPRAGGLERVNVGSGAASDYDPQGDDGEESPEATRNAIDGNPTTNWATATYRAGFEGVRKDGVGLYLDAGSPVAGRRLDLTTATPGWNGAVYAANAVPSTLTGWTRVSGRERVAEKQRFSLDTAGQRFRFYLVWISSLPEGNKASILELGLYR